MSAPRIAASLALVLATACSGGGAPPTSTTPPTTTPPTTPPPPKTLTLVWSDEFDGAAGSPVDPAKWTHDLGDGCSSGSCGWGNNEREYYTNAPQNASLDGQGHLQIVALLAPPGMSCYYGACRYTSAKITTRGKMNAAPGKVEARIKLPAGQGLWPAFWMLGSEFPTVPWPDCGELDIMENKGSAPGSTSSAVHGRGYFGATPFAQTQFFSNPNSLSTDFHVYTVEWDSDIVRFSVDGTQHYQVVRSQMEQYGTPVLGQPYFVILNLAVGGTFDGNPASDAIFPAAMVVDWVHVYAAS